VVQIHLQDFVLGETTGEGISQYDFLQFTFNTRFVTALKRQMQAHYLLSDGTRPGNNSAAAQVIPCRAQDCSDVESRIHIKRCVFGRDDCVDELLRHISEGHIIAQHSGGIGDLIEQLTVAVVDGIGMSGIQIHALPDKIYREKEERRR